MSTITASAALIGQTGSFTGVNHSGTFIPTLWSSKLAQKFYTATVFSEIANTDWAGEIKNLGDKVVINKIPTLAINAYQVGTSLTYQVPTPNTVELAIDKGYYFAFQVNDVIKYQSEPAIMDMFANDASMQLKIKIDSTALFNLALNSTYGTPAAGNSGTTAGVKSGAYNLGTNTSPVALTASNVLSLLTSLASVLDEQNIPETDRWLIIDPVTRNLLMQSNLAQAQFMGDDKSIVRNGKIGMIDRFTVYVSNNLPRGAASAAMASGDGTETIGATHTAARRLLMAGHKAAFTFASQITKVETVRNPSDFGDYVRGLQVCGFKATNPEAFAIAYVS